MVGAAAAGLAIAIYLTLVKLSGGVPACGPLIGCETVNTSIYSEFLGIPVALYGAAASAVVLVAALSWWRTRSRPALMVAYAVGLASLPVLAYLTYLELFVIRAVCAWCVAYALTVIIGWVIAALTVFGRGRDEVGAASGDG